jgi:hypothetical protein
MFKNLLPFTIFQINWILCNTLLFNHLAVNVFQNASQHYAAELTLFEITNEIEGGCYSEVSPIKLVLNLGCLGIRLAIVWRWSFTVGLTVLSLKMF